MRYVLIFIIVIANFCFKGLSQVQVKEKSNSQSLAKAITGMSYFWKLDSLANNGYRACSFNRLLNARLDSITVDFLISNFGQPNKIWETNKGKQYVYYCYDHKNIPHEKNNPIECVYISFSFAKNESRFVGVGDGVIHY